jgi:ABC-type uncharacterized transport system permease subunit
VELYLLYALFLYLLSILLVLAENRTELKLAGIASRLSYKAGSIAVLAILAVSVYRAGGAWVMDFFSGTLITLAILFAVYSFSRLFGRFSLAPAIFSLVSLVLGVMALARRGAAPGLTMTEGWTRYTSSHVICMFIALAAFTLSLIFSVMFLAQDRLLKKKSGGPLFAALPPLELTSRLNFSFITVGTAALAMGVFGGTAALSGMEGFGEALKDPSILLSVLMLVLYVGLAVLRKGALERARTVSVVSIIFYLLLLFVFWGAHAGR